MKALKHRLPILLLLAGMGFATATHAELIAKLNGTVVYDTDRNITWLADANLAASNTFETSAISSEGGMSWYAAQSWVTAMNTANYLGYNNWRLPTALNADGSGPTFWHSADSELAHLFYNELGGVADQSISTTHNANFNLFSNIQDWYWSGTEYAPDINGAWVFGTSVGLQTQTFKGNGINGWAVRSGDVAAVPEPEEYMMMLLGFGMVGWQLKRKQRKSAPVVA